ncbi:MAG TPA: thermonuclease family protein [Gammaproteobacteria bacterium]|nr:thermonuclease family protein [Gammaproteobacteria bacterium]
MNLLSAALHLALALPFATHAVAETSGVACAAPATAQVAEVRTVLDGDTLVLAQNWRLRLIGINAPELAHGGRASEHWSDEARAALASLLPQGTAVRYTLGAEPADRYGRLLGYVWRAQDGLNVHAALVRQGFAVRVALPPNLALDPCLATAEAEARAAGRGLWRPPGPWLPAAAFPPERRGFVMLEGHISARKERRAGLILMLDDRLELFLPAAARGAFRELESLLVPGTRLRVRGWVGSHRGQPSLRLEHPAMLELPAAREHAKDRKAGL